MIHILHGIGIINLTVFTCGLILAHDLSQPSPAPVPIRIRTGPKTKDNPFAPPGDY